MTTQNDLSDPPDDIDLAMHLEQIGGKLRRSKSGRVLSVDFRESPASVDTELAKQLIRLPRLKEIYLPQTAIGDGALDALLNLKRLTVLNLDGTTVSDIHMDRILELEKLTLLSITDTQVSREKVAELRKKMIGTRIVFR